MSFSMLRAAVVMGCLGSLFCAQANAELDPLTVQIQPLAQSSLITDITNAGEQLIAVGQRGHILRRTDVWQQVVTPTVSQLTKVFFLDANLGWAVGHDASIIHTQDGGKTWALQMQSNSLEKPFLDIRFFDVNEGIAIGAYGLFYRTLDGGKTWASEFHEELLFEEDVSYLADLKVEDEALYLSERAALLPHFNRIIRLTDQRLLLVGELGLVAESNDNGRHFTRTDFDYDGSMFNAIQLDNQVYVMGLRGHVFKTDLSLSNWQQVTLPVGSSINAAIKHQDSVYLVGNAGIILRLDGKGHVEIIARRQGENIVAVAKDENGQLWFGGTSGIFQLNE